MFNQMKKRIKNEKGLTLIELLAVIVILAIVSAIAVPSIGGIIENSRYNAVKADAINVLNAANLYFTDEPADSDVKNVTVETLKTNGYLDNAGKFEDVLSTATVTRDSGGNTLEGTVTYSGEKTVEFSGATITSINADNKKGSSDESPKTIDGTP